MMLRMQPLSTKFVSLSTALLLQKIIPSWPSIRFITTRILAEDGYTRKHSTRIQRPENQSLNCQAVFFSFVYPPAFGFRHARACFPFFISCNSSVCCVQRLCDVEGPQGNQLGSQWASMSPSPPLEFFRKPAAGSASTGRSHCLAVITVQQGWQWCSRSPKFPADHLSSTSLRTHKQSFPQHTKF